MKIVNKLTRRQVDEGLRYAFFLVVLLTGSLVNSSCDRRELTYSETSEVVLTADWSRADLDEEKAYGSTAIFYPQDGGKPCVALMGDRTRSTVRLPLGSYDVVLFNRSFDDFGAVAFRGQDKFETLEAYARKVETRSDTRIIVSSPEKLATAVIRNFKVTVGCELHFEPTPLTRKIQTTLRVKGLHNVRNARCTLSNIPLSVFLADGRPSTDTGSQEFVVANPVFDEGSSVDGTLTGTLNVFGINTEAPHNVTLNAQLIDGKTEVQQQLTGVTIREADVGDNVLVLYIEASSPEPLPDVKPEGGSDSGFDADVGEWGEETTEEIPV